MNDSARGVWIRVSIWTFKRFIYTRLGMVIDVRLSTLCGHIVANSISNFTLFIFNSESWIRGSGSYDHFHNSSLISLIIPALTYFLC
ncbi:uncharacterized protein LOC126626130 isoform X2 [Malus sylvestris]|uniref:uncharacterized protein LOC126626130 isoform X2 n=1 Tax=Malus sylvestris TaxID=3752 RepID=UPI0021ACF929|nr:uncharacterized protein LOC126626130 isoform X2 [Malus sylvestris]